MSINPDYTGPKHVFLIPISQNSLVSKPPLPAHSPGRSGAKFFLSHDKKLVMKSITSEEVALLHLILQAYHAVSVLTDSLCYYHYNIMYKGTNPTATLSM